MGAYQECGEHHYASEGDKVSRPRRGVVKNVRFFRYLHGRGILYMFAGSMAFGTIPGHFSYYPEAVLALGLPGIALMVLGLGAVRNWSSRDLLLDAPTDVYCRR